MTYKTSQIAKICGIHPNTVRFYEEMGFLQSVQRQKNQYRIFTDIHILQIQLIQIGFRCEIVNGNLRKCLIDIIETSALGDYSGALRKIKQYQDKLQKMKNRAEDAILFAQEYAYTSINPDKYYTWDEVLNYLDITKDVLRNWERNGLIKIPQKENGRKYFTSFELGKLSVIAVLRDAHHSILAVLRMVQFLEKPHNGSLIDATMDKTWNSADFINETDKLLLSLQKAQENAEKMVQQIKNLHLTTTLISSDKLK